MDEILLWLLGGFAALKVLGGSGQSGPAARAPIAPGGYSDGTHGGSYYSPATSAKGKTIDQLAAEVSVHFSPGATLPDPWGTGVLSVDQQLLSACMQRYGSGSLEAFAVAFAVSLDKSASITKPQSDALVAEARAQGRWCFTRAGVMFDPTDPKNIELSDGTWVLNGSYNSDGRDDAYDGMNAGLVCGIQDAPSNILGDIGTALEDVGKGVVFVVTAGQENLFSSGNSQSAGIAAGAQQGEQMAQQDAQDVANGNGSAILGDLGQLVQL